MGKISSSHADIEAPFKSKPSIVAVSQQDGIGKMSPTSPSSSAVAVGGPFGTTSSALASEMLYCVVSAGCCRAD